MKKIKELWVNASQDTPWTKRKSIVTDALETGADVVFVNEGEISVRAPDHYIHLTNNSGILAKCIPYFVENSNSTFDQKIEVLGIMLYPEVIEELFNFSLFDSSYKLNYNEKKLIIDQQLQSFKESILLLIKKCCPKFFLGVIFNWFKISFTSVLFIKLIHIFVSC